MRDKDFDQILLDRILDEALETYTAREPRPGLERRVLHRVAAAGGERRMWWWFAAVAACACALAISFLLRTKPVQAPVAYARGSVTAPPPPTEPRPSRSGVTHRTTKPRQFPTPAPLTPEERALLNFATRFPEQAVAAFAPAEQPIAIPEIEIKPLDNGS